MRIKKISQTSGTIGSIVNSNSNSSTDAYSCSYINDKVEPVSQTVSSATFYKIGKLVVVSGWFVINGTSKTFTAPYKPTTRVWAAANGLTNVPAISTINCWVDIATNGTITITATSAATYCTAGFCYLTND